MSTRRGCTQCGNCLITCPVFRTTLHEEHSPKAKQDLLQLASENGTELDWEKSVSLAGLCVSCERCLQTCPRKLSVPEALSAARQKKPRWHQYFWREWIKRGATLWPVSARMASVTPNALFSGVLQVMHSAALSMSERAPHQPWFGLAQGASKIFADMPILFFEGCTAMRLRPSWTEKVKKTLHALGARLFNTPDLVCCGGTYEHAGMRQSALEAARTNLNCWRSLDRPKVVAICASCLRSLRHYPAMPGLLQAAEAKIWLEALTPLSDCLRQAETALTPHAPTSYFYHSPCHWGGKDADMLWLKKALPGLRKGKTLCCGFGGVFKLMNPFLSRSMAEKCWEGFGPAVNTVLTGCSGCSMQLAAHAPQNAEILHWLDIWYA